MLAGPYFAMTHFLIITNDSVSCWLQRIRNFHKISSSHRGTMTWVNYMQCFKERFIAITIVTIMMMMVMIACVTVLCSEFVLFIWFYLFMKC